MDLCLREPGMVESRYEYMLKFPFELHTEARWVVGVDGILHRYRKGGIG